MLDVQEMFIDWMSWIKEMCFKILIYISTSFYKPTFFIKNEKFPPKNIKFSFLFYVIT